MKMWWLLICLLSSLSIHAQAIDKAEKDLLIYQELTANYELENWHPDLIIASHMLKETDEEGIFYRQRRFFPSEVH